MLRRIAIRLAVAPVVLLGVVTATFFLGNLLPSDPAALFAGELATEEQVEAVRQEMGLDRPVAAQYVSYVKDLAQGDLGESLTTRRAIADEVKSRATTTLTLILLGTAAATLFGIVIGAVAGIRRGAVGRAARLTLGSGLAIPDFVLGLVLILVFYYHLRAFPAPLGQVPVGAEGPDRVTGSALVDGLLAGDLHYANLAASQLVLPVVTIMVVYGSIIGRMAEQAYREAWHAPHITYGRLSGLHAVRLFAGATRSALSAILTQSGIVLGYMLGGIVMVEIVFSWDGVASYAVNGMLSADVPVIQAFVLLSTIFVLLIYLALDLVYAVIDPRIRH